jgi:Raf kinase inhibitor-like YbhB/YbcL family protein
MRAKIALIALTFALVNSAWADVFIVGSNAAASEGQMPEVYTCNGKNISPQVSWKNTPAKTESLALIVSDPDAPGGTFYHWVLYNIPRATTNVKEGVKTLPAGTVTGTNSFGQQNYQGPCPPPGSIHHYNFTVYALDTKLSLAAGADANQVKTALENHVLGAATYTMLYTRNSA